MNWDEFAQASPELAVLGRERFENRELCMLGTLRANGWPRISPCELDFVDDELLLGTRRGQGTDRLGADGSLSPVRGRRRVGRVCDLQR